MNFRLYFVLIYSITLCSMPQIDMPSRCTSEDVGVLSHNVSFDQDVGIWEVCSNVCKYFSSWCDSGLTCFKEARKNAKNICMVMLALQAIVPMSNALKVENINQNHTYTFHGPSVRFTPIVISEAVADCSMFFTARPPESGVLLCASCNTLSDIQLKKTDTVSHSLIKSGSSSELNSVLTGIHFVPSGSYNGTISIDTLIFDEGFSARAEGVMTLTFDSSTISVDLPRHAGFTIENQNQSLSYDPQGAAVVPSPLVLSVNQPKRGFRTFLCLRPPESGMLLRRDEVDAHSSYVVVQIGDCALSRVSTGTDFRNYQLSVTFVPSRNYFGTVSILSIFWEGQRSNGNYDNFNRAESLILLHPVNVTGTTTPVITTVKTNHEESTALSSRSIVSTVMKTTPGQSQTKQSIDSVISSQGEISHSDQTTIPTSLPTDTSEAAISETTILGSTAVPQVEGLPSGVLIGVPLGGGLLLGSVGGAVVYCLLRLRESRRPDDQDIEASEMHSGVSTVQDEGTGTYRVSIEMPSLEESEYRQTQDITF